MNHSHANTHTELCLEPMQEDNCQQSVFGDFSSRDPKRKRTSKRAARVCVPVRNVNEKLFAGDHTRKVTGKSSFLVDDRRTPDRRRANRGRRSSIRMTEDRRTSSNRREIHDPWEREFRA